MHRISRSLFAFVASCALAISSAPAAVRAANIAAAPVATRLPSNSQAPSTHSNSPSRRPARAARKARKASKGKPAILAPAHAIVYKPSNKNFAATQKTAQAESNARAERLYRASQLSAPIIIDAKACKRVGAHGESIYENC